MPITIISPTIRKLLAAQSSTAEEQLKQEQQSKVAKVVFFSLIGYYLYKESKKNG